MITGAHIIICSKEAEADRAFFREILNFPHVDVGHGWLIFRLPPAELRRTLHGRSNQLPPQRVTWRPLTPVKERPGSPSILPGVLERNFSPNVAAPAHPTDNFTTRAG